MTHSLHIAVRNLVEHVLRTGDLELAFFSSARTIDAIRAHQTVQQSRPETYLAEVPVAHQIDLPPFRLHISGRMDGVFTETDDDQHLPMVEEIKTTTQDLDIIAAAANPLHWGQAKVYAYLYAMSQGLNRIGIQLTYVQLASGKRRELRQRFEIDDLKAFVYDLVSRYVQWAATIIDWVQIKEQSIEQLVFPFGDYRSGQRQMAVAVFRAIQQNDQLIVQAATGIGKTMAALFPAVKAMGEGHTRKIFYLTARTTARAAAENTFALLKDNGLRLKTLTITAKDKICFRPDAACTAEECEFAKGFYDRIQEAIADIFQTDAFTRPVVEQFARTHCVCPFEFSLELALWVDAIICDYNYAFDPRVHLRRFFGEENGQYTFLIDEAHNLVDRSREMFSAVVFKKPFLELRRSVKSDLPGVYKILGKINTWMLKARKRCPSDGGTYIEKSPPEGILPLLKQFLFATEKWLVRNQKAAYRESLLELYYTAMAFTRVFDQYDATYATCYERKHKDLSVELFCIDPSLQLKEALQRCQAAVFFSATMTPAHYFKKMFGCEEDTDALALPCPFPADNLGVYVVNHISTYYRHRSRTAADVTRILTKWVQAKIGNYLLFFPSYQYMQQIHQRFVAKKANIETIIQTPDMSEADREGFLKRFSVDNADWLIGFAVMGGIFGEGIDLVGERLSGAAIIGVGLPAICPERELIRDYFSEIYDAGYEFAYTYPGINRVLQAAGRVIRSEEDRGVVLLLDPRFGTVAYQALLPPEWTPVRVGSLQRLEGYLARFWED